MALPRALFASLAAVALLFRSGLALADKVTVLPLTGAGTTKAETDGMRDRSREAATDRGHTLPSSSEQLTAEMAVKDGVADTREEYSAAGRASSADWAVGGRVESRGHYVRVEIEACQVASGRVESLARNIEPGAERRKLAEMLALLLRPEGIANASTPWSNEAPPEPKPAPAPVPVPVPTPAPAPAPAPPPAAPAPPAPPPPPYAEHHPFAVGLGAGVLAAALRPKNASGSATTVDLLGSFGYALDAVPGLELRGELGAGVVAPRSLFVAGGARYAVVLSRSVYVGPEAQLGAFVPFGGDKEARFLVRAQPFVGARLADALAVEAFGDAIFAFGGTGTLGLVGGGARAVVRF